MGKNSSGVISYQEKENTVILIAYRKTLHSWKNVLGRNADVLEHHVASDARTHRELSLDRRRAEAACAALDQKRADRGRGDGRAGLRLAQL